MHHHLVRQWPCTRLLTRLFTSYKAAAYLIHTPVSCSCPLTTMFYLFLLSVCAVLQSFGFPYRLAALGCSVPCTRPRPLPHKFGLSQASRAIGAVLVHLQILSRLTA